MPLIKRLVLSLGLVSLLGSCSEPVIPNTDVVDTPQNRAVITFASSIAGPLSSNM